MSPIPKKHEELLEHQIKHLHEGEEIVLLMRFDQIRPNIRTTERKLIDDMIEDLDRFVDAIKTRREELNDRQFQVMLAALKYFIHDADYIDEDFAGLTGLVDDALVVSVAKRELKDLF